MSYDFQDKVGARIRDLRISQSLSQERLGFMTGMAKTYISEIESGKKNFTLSTLQKLASALGTTPAHIVDVDKPLG